MKIAVVLYYLFPKRLRQYVLLAASILFYLTYGVRMAGYLAATILLTYLFGLWLDRLAAFRPAAETKEERKRQKRANDRKKRRVLALSLVLNFASLALLKYGGFLAAAVNSVLGTELPLPHFLLPLGISFYIFQTSAYLIDISRGKHRAERSFLRYALVIVCIFSIKVSLFFFVMNFDDSTASISNFSSGNSNLRLATKYLL